ncbi:MFS family permease [Streptomyces sp. SAI-144]|uniref:MFS transporter n=1 Tax=Streptomyces sp. SAI-144 TaxID=2940544 RepID=UPI0024760F5A|nr:MFS transporter [Streptomyces sp. SAI-144]MDH6440259.1 MFS family permease [Streptomyces sp. SAI-144]
MSDVMAPQGAPPQRPPKPVWTHRNFMLLWAGQTASEMGTRVSNIALPLLAVTTLHASAFQVSLITAFTWLPYVFFALPAGVITDRVRTRRLMVWCDILRTVLVASIPASALWWRPSLGYLYVVVAACGVLTVFFNVAYRALLPSLVDEDQLISANGKMGMSQSLAELAGPAVGGLLTGVLGALRTMWVDASSFLLSVATLVMIKTRDPRTEPGPPAERQSFRKQVSEGLRYVLKHPILSRLLLCSSTSNFFVMGMSGIEIVYLVKGLHASPMVVGLVFSVGTVGGLITGMLASRISERVGTARVIWLSMVVPGPLYLLIPLSFPGWGIVLYALGLTAFSANAVLYNAAESSYRQRVCPPEMRGRMSASMLWIAYGTIPLGALFGGALASWIGMRPALVVFALGMWAASLFVVFSPLRGLRDIPTT